MRIPSAFPLVMLLLATCALLAQRGERPGFGGRRGFRGGGYLEDARTPREITQHGAQTPYWTNTPSFEKDVFTFVRIKRAGGGYRGGGYGSGGPWTTDTPDSDLNLSFRLQQVSSFKVDPDGLFLRLTDPELVEHPLIYMVEP